MLLSEIIASCFYMLDVRIYIDVTMQIVFFLEIVAVNAIKIYQHVDTLTTFFVLDWAETFRKFVLCHFELELQNAANKYIVIPVDPDEISNLDVFFIA